MTSLDMGSRPCDICGGKAIRFAKYATCGPCLDRSVEYSVWRARELRAEEALLNAIAEAEKSED